MSETLFAPTAAAAVVFMIGAPVAHAHLPGAFNRRFAEERLDAMMAPLDVAPAALGAFFAALKGWANCRGCVVTAPHKPAALALVDEASERARMLEAVNVVSRAPDGRLVGDNVDGAGFVRGLATRAFSPAGARVVLFGCGGAGASIALALAEAGAAALRLVDLDPARAERLAATLAAYPGPSVELGAPESLERDDLVINATAVGLDGRSMVHPLDGVRPGALVADVLATAEPTPWLRAAHAKGCATLPGSAMAEGQLELVAARLGLAIGLDR